MLFTSVAHVRFVKNLFSRAIYQVLLMCTYYKKKKLGGVIHYRDLYLR